MKHVVLILSFVATVQAATIINSSAACSVSDSNEIRTLASQSGVDGCSLAYGETGGQTTASALFTATQSGPSIFNLTLQMQAYGAVHEVHTPMDEGVMVSPGYGHASAVSDVIHSFTAERGGLMRWELYMSSAAFLGASSLNVSSDLFSAGCYEECYLSGEAEVTLGEELTFLLGGRVEAGSAYWMSGSSSAFANLRLSFLDSEQRSSARMVHNPEPATFILAVSAALALGALRRFRGAF